MIARPAQRWGHNCFDWCCEPAAALGCTWAGAHSAGSIRVRSESASRCLHLHFGCLHKCSEQSLTTLCEAKGMGGADQSAYAPQPLRVCRAQLAWHTLPVATHRTWLHQLCSLHLGIRGSHSRSGRQAVQEQSSGSVATGGACTLVCCWLHQAS